MLKKQFIQSRLQIHFSNTLSVFVELATEFGRSFAAWSRPSAVRAQTSPFVAVTKTRQLFCKLLTFYHTCVAGG